MKPFKKIITLSVIVLSIVLFWLVPGINKARDVQYTRIYEDTDRKPKLFPTRDSLDRKHQKKSSATSSKKIIREKAFAQILNSKTLNHTCLADLCNSTLKIKSWKQLLLLIL